MKSEKRMVAINREAWDKLHAWALLHGQDVHEAFAEMVDKKMKDKSILDIVSDVINKKEQDKELTNENTIG